MRSLHPSAQGPASAPQARSHLRSHAALSRHGPFPRGLTSPASWPGWQGLPGSSSENNSQRAASTPHGVDTGPAGSVPAATLPAQVATAAEPLGQPWALALTKGARFLPLLSATSLGRCTVLFQACGRVTSGLGAQGLAQSPLDSSRRYSDGDEDVLFKFRQRGQVPCSGPPGPFRALGGRSLDGVAPVG